MTEKKNNVVGILQNRDIRTIIQALEKFEKEAKEQDTFDVGNALGMFRLIQKNMPDTSLDSAYTIRWEGSLEKALEAIGRFHRRMPDVPRDELIGRSPGEWDE